MLASNSSELLVDQITPPLSFAFVCPNIFLGIVCIIGNLLVTVAMIRSKDTSFSTKLASTWILFHLAISAFFIGIWALICGIHLLAENMRRNIWIDHVRRFFGVVAPGTLILLLGCISYDRYILLKHHTNHNKYMSKKKTFALIALCWLLPLPVSFLRYLSHLGFYLLVAGAIILLFIVLITAYSFIIKLVFRSEEKMGKSNDRTDFLQHHNSFTDLTLNSEDEENRIEMNHHQQDDYPIKPSAGNNPSSRGKLIKDFMRLKKTLRLAKTVSKLLTTYLVFHLLMVCYLLVRVIKPSAMNKKEQEITLLVVEIFSQINATLVPLVYFTSINAYKKDLKKMLCSRK